MFLPFALLSPRAAAVVWLGVEIGFLIVLAFILVRTARVRAPPLVILVLPLSLTLLRPFREEVTAGQLMILMLLLVAAARLAFASSRAPIAGVLLGLSMSVKFFTWPLLLVCALRRDWRVIASGVGTVIFLYVIALIVMGPGAIIDYFVRALPANAETYHYTNNLGNLSTWTIGPLLFDQVDFTDPPGYASMPLLYTPMLAKIVSVAVPSIVLVVGTLLAYRHPVLDRSFGVAVCVAIMVSPLVWPTYLVLAILPVVQLLVSLGWRALLSRWGALVLSSALVLSAPGHWVQLAHLLAGESWTPSNAWTPVPRAPALIVLMPTLALGTLSWALLAMPLSVSEPVMRLADVSVARPRPAAAWVSVLRGGNKP